MNKELIIEIENFNESYDELYLKVETIERNLRALVFDFANKISGKISNDIIVNLSYDIMFRIKSIMYLTRLINQEEINVLKQLQDKSLNDQHIKRRLSLELVENQKTLFDSILYHLSSIYDYYASLSGYLYTYKPHTKWNSLVNMAYDKNNTRIAEEQKKTIVETHSEFVDSLFRHRSSLIHNNASHPGFKFTEDLKLGKHKIAITTPKKFIKAFKLLEAKITDNPISLKASLFWILNHGFKDIGSLLFGLKDELERLKKTELKDNLIVDIRNPKRDISERLWKKE